MSKPVIITSDSTCDLSVELLERYGIKTIPLIITLGDDSYLDGESFGIENIYERYYKDGTLPKTAAPSIVQFYDFFKGFVDQGYDVVHIDISSELSCTFSNASLAADEYEGVFVVDSTMLSSGVGLLVIEAAECRDKGMSATEIAEHIKGLRRKVDTSFVLETLEFMRKGGRCSAVAALAANALKIRPALEMKDGKLQVYKKYRGNMESVYLQYIKDRVKDKCIRKGHVFVTNSGKISDEILNKAVELVKELINPSEIHFAVAGCTISSHCGPGCFGVLFINE